MTGNGLESRRRQGAGLAIVMFGALLWAAPGANAAASDPHVASFGADPPFINLNRTTTVTLEIASSFGAGEDNYQVSVYAPDGGLAAFAWYNFSVVGAMSMTLGNATSGFNATVTQVGSYRLLAEHWNSTAGALEFASEAPLLTTDRLLVTTETATASNPYTDLHNCPLASEFQRGDEIIARAYVRYLSTGEILNATNVPTARNNVTGTLFGLTKIITYNAQTFWRAAWFIPWDQALGAYIFNVSASDGLGNVGTGSTPPAGYLAAVRVVAATLRTTVWTANVTTGSTATAFYPGETVQIVVRSTYELHLAHNYLYTNTNSVDKNQSYPVGPDRSGAAVAAIGYGAFNSTSGQYAENLANVTLAFDAATGTWRGTWPVSSSTPLRANLSLSVKVTDGAPTPNLGKASVTFATMPLPPPEIITNTVYQNQTIEVAKAGTMDSTLGYGLLVVGLAAGVGAGFALMRRGGGKGPESAGAPSETKTAEGEKAEKKKDEGWS